MLNDKKSEQIIEYSFKLFINSGYSNVTMDDIARGLGMGKGTLYKYFSSKEELLLCNIEAFASRITGRLSIMMSDESLTPVDKLKGFSNLLSGELSILKSSALSDIFRGSPTAIQKIEEARQKIINDNLTRLFEEGKEAGIFKPELDSKLTAHIFIGAIGHITEPEFLLNSGYTPDRIFISVLSTILNGCFTDEGRKITEN